MLEAYTCMSFQKLIPNINDLKEHQQDVSLLNGLFKSIKTERLRYFMDAPDIWEIKKLISAYTNS